MANNDKANIVKILISQARALEASVNRVLNDTTTQPQSRYVSFKQYAIRYNDIAREAEKTFGLPYGSFSVYKVNEMKSYMDTLWGTQKQVVESVSLEIATLLTYLESIDIREQPMNVNKKKLLRDYAEIKKTCPGNMVITISEVEYPKYKDTLDYLERYEFIRSIDIDNANMYMKTSAFDSFTEYMLAMEPEEDEPMTQTYNNKKVFVVHGHDHALLDEVELMLRRVGLEPVIVKNEANSGRTIIQKITDLSDVGFGIILYTCCDEGRKKGDSELRDRARQNVIFEHGYLYAKLGPGRVAAINDSGIEIPSDLSGVLYVPRSASDWKNQLMREMKAAGLEFDATKA